MESAATKQIRLKLEEYYEAFHVKDWGKFGSILTDDFKYFTDGAAVMYKNEFVEFLKKNSWQGIDYRISALEIHTSASIDLGVAVYKISFKGLVKESERTVNAIETTLFLKENNVWKILHCHASNEM